MEKNFESLVELNDSLRARINDCLVRDISAYNMSIKEIGVAEMPDEGECYSDGLYVIHTCDGSLYLGYGENNGALGLMTQEQVDEFVEGQLGNNAFLVDSYSLEDIESTWTVEDITDEAAGVLEELAMLLIGRR